MWTNINPAEGITNNACAFEAHFQVPRAKQVKAPVRAPRGNAWEREKRGVRQICKPV